jgi:single-strand DNA-binding protein
MLAQHLAKGRRVGIDGRLDWSSWEAQDGTKRSKVEIVAFQVQFLDSRGDGESQSQYIPSSDVAADQSDFVKTGAAADDDIPF